MNEISTKERFVVYLDIMGFKERVSTTSTDRLYSDLTDFNKSITNIVNSFNTVSVTSKKKKNDESTESMPLSADEEVPIMISQFSDSIMLYSRDSSQECLKTISMITKEVFISAMKRDFPIPLRGAISKGIMTCDPSKQVYFGQALIDAYQLEENVIYYGMVVHHTAEKDVMNMSDFSYYQIKPLPLRSGSIEHYELEWYRDYIPDVNLGLDAIRLTTSEAPRRYIDNTRRIINSNEEKESKKIVPHNTVKGLIPAPVQEG